MSRGAGENGAAGGTTRRRLISGLVLDRGHTPRKVGSYHVNELEEALRAGKTLPPILVDRETSRVVDGFHRIEAHRRVYGREALVEVVEKAYAGEAEMFLDAARINDSHGRRLSSYEQLRCVEITHRLSVDPRRVAGALSLRPRVFEELVAKRFGTEITTRAPIPLKRTIQHMKGQFLTREQIEVNDKLGGQPQSFYVTQIILLVQSDLLDTGDPDLMRRLGRLKELLEGVDLPER